MVTVRSKKLIIKINEKVHFLTYPEIPLQTHPINKLASVQFTAALVAIEKYFR